MASRVGRVPAWAWLTAIVVGSSLLRLWLVRGMVAPFVFVDELIYSELAKSLADGGGYAIREVPTSGYSLVYPALIAPAWALFDDGVTAYNAAKSINAVVMSLAAVPTYLLAVRVARPPAALVAAVIAVAVPSMAYTATITTESLFYPLALCVALALVRYLETASWRRLLVLLGALAVAFATRSQALAFVPVLLTAPLALALIHGRGALRRYSAMYAVIGGGGILVLVVQAVRGLSPFDLLGAYSTVGESDYDVGQVLRFWLWHVEELTLYVAIVPLVALGVLAARARSLPPRVQEHVAVTVAFFVWSTLSVAMFASRFASDRIQDRYLFFLTPLLVVALVAWVELGAIRPRVIAVLVGAIALASTLVFPYTRFIGEPAKSDTVGLLPLWAANEHLVGGSYAATVAIGGAVMLGLFLLVPARYALSVPLAVLVVFALLSRPVWTSDKGFELAGKGALFQGIRSAPRTWIDGAVPTGEEVVALWTGAADRFTINESEFFNRAVGRVFYTDAPTPGGVGEEQLRRGEDGVYHDPAGRPVAASYALLDSTVEPDGVVVARDEALGIALWRLRSPLMNKVAVDGLYPGGTWSGPDVKWTRVRCEPGTLTVRLHSDPNLFSGSQTVSATSATSRSDPTVAQVSFPVTAERALLKTRVAPDADGVCTVRFRVEPTANPSETVPGSIDDRVLGAHFDAFTYVPTK